MARPPSPALPNGLPVGLYRSAPDGRILDANDTMAEMLGYSDRAGLLGVEAGSLYVDPGDRTRLRERLERINKVRAYTVELRRADGRRIWGEMNIVVTRDPVSGEVVWEGALTDITERRLAEDALWDSERRLRLMMEQMPAVLWSVDRNLVFTLSLGAGLAALGLKPNQIVGTSLQEFAGSDDPEAPMIAAHRRALSGESVSFRIEWLGRLYEAHVEPFHDVQGRTAGVLGIALDVTERRRAEVELQRMLAMLQSTLDSTDDGILVLDRDGNVTTFNRRFAEMWNLPPELLATRDSDTWLEAALQWVEDPEGFSEGVRQLRARPDSFDRSRIRLRDGRVLERSVLPQRVDGRTVGHVLSFREVSGVTPTG